MVLSRRGLVVGNFCHDVIIRDHVVVGESLGGAASFILNVLNGLSIDCDYVSKVGPDFTYSVSACPIVSSTSKTTLFHANFSSQCSEVEGHPHADRILKRVHSCEPIRPDDLPESEKFDFGMAVGVGGEILPEALEKMVEMCNVVFADIQALIREFDEIDGTVRLIRLKDSRFYHLLPRIGFLKASAEEEGYVDLEEVRKWCCVVVTNGKSGCRVYRRNEEFEISAFPTMEVDPTGAGDSFLGGFVAGLVQGLAVPDAALLGNLFGSLTVGQIGLPKFDSKLLKRVKAEVQKRKLQCCLGFCEKKEEELDFTKPDGHEQFHASLSAAKSPSSPPVQACQCDLPNLASKPVIHGISCEYSGQQGLLLNTVCDESVEEKP
ncbi:hypothetical protein Nepgr_014064 [Nepenthes gracilis]|uniref:Carbohydrate kinase PfkB domain-containing protein n=1 Tax=Nepenthes gracilis TaxID=150966 RepID=A0AAD3XPI4_NEPGR|nr:hypothetical protein Nepgr_014064 [Nepenthes gracilis]